jgi:hypothetical protein
MVGLGVRKGEGDGQGCKHVGKGCRCHQHGAVGGGVTNRKSTLRMGILDVDKRGVPAKEKGVSIEGHGRLQIGEHQQGQWTWGSLPAVLLDRESLLNCMLVVCQQQ